MRSKPVIYIFVLCFFANFFIGKSYHNCINFDKAGYYLYLPAVFIDHDLAKLEFYKKVDVEYQPAGDMKWYGINQDTVTQRRYDKYPAGVAIMELPFFLVARSFTYFTNSPVLYGYSEPYQVAVCLACFFWLMFGVIHLRKVLLRYFGDGVVAVTLVVILFATNIWYYGIFDLGMSHPFSFGLYALLVYFTDNWYRFKKGRDVVLLGILMGLIVITRPTNMVAVIIPLCWYGQGIHSLKERIRFYLSQSGYIVIGAICGTAILAIQFSYWHYITGHWIIYSYRGEYFDFAHPHIWEGMTSYNKGWLVYSPAAIFFILGFWSLLKYYKQLAGPILIFTVVNFYVVFSWSFWQYGGGFGARALIESYAVLSFPLASFVLWLSTEKRLFKLSFNIIILIFILLNLVQTYQVVHRILPGIWINKNDYWNLFLRLSSSS